VIALQQELEGEIVLVLGRVPTKAMSIQDWARHKMAALEDNPDVSQLRTRSFTWSYTQSSSPAGRPGRKSDKKNER
jgi:hypothetical protein